MNKPNYIRPLDLRNGRVDMNHGAGGRASAQLIEELFLRTFDNPYLRQGNDGATLPLPPEVLQGGRLVMATDAHVVSPIFFPGGDLGCLAVHGTLNDVAMLGARPAVLVGQLYLGRGLPAGRPATDRAIDGRGGAAGGRAYRDRRHQGGGAGQGRRRVHQHHGRGRAGGGRGDRRRSGA